MSFSDLEGQPPLLTQSGGWQRPLSGVLVLSVLSAQTDGLAYRSFFMTCRSGPCFAQSPS